MAGQMSNMVGTLAGYSMQLADNAANTMGSTVAPLSNRVLAAVDRPASLTATGAALTAAALVGVGALVRVKTFHHTVGLADGAMPGVIAGVGVGLRQPEEILENTARLTRLKQGLNRVAAVTAASRMAGSLAADLSKTGEGERALAQTRRTFLGGDRKLTVEFNASRLTPLLNRSDRLVSSKSIVSSDGDMVSLGRQSWHRGTTVVRMPEGEQTITHLSSLALPASSFYFNRRLADEELAGLVSGQLQAHRLAGYVGGISPAENLAPAWSQAKRAMILTRLHWPTPEKGKRGPTWETVPVVEAEK